MTPTTDTPDGTTDERYGAFETGDGGLVVYDRDEPTAWIQSDYAVDVDGRTAGPLRE